jgi:hypothetical protein
MQAKLIITFDRLSTSDFLAISGSIVNAMTNNSHFKEPWAGQGLTLDQLTAAYTAYEEAYHASLTRDFIKIAQRNATRQTLTEILKRLALSLELMAQGDVTSLATTGFELRHDIVRSNSNELLPAPAGFRVTHGQLSGSFDVHVTRLPGAGSYEVHITEDNPNLKSNWRHAITSVNSLHIIVTGLIPGQNYWVRIRGIDSNGGGVWSDPINIFAI